MNRINALKIKNEHGKVYLHWIFFPLFLIYLDLLLSLFTSTPNKAILTTLLLDLAMGLLLSTLTSIFSPKVNRIIALVLVWALAFFFSMQFVLHGQFSMYVDIKTIFAGTGNVVDDYGNMVIKAIVGEAPGMIIFSLPAIFYTIFGNKLLSCAAPTRWWAAVLIGAAAVIFAASLITVRTGPSRNVYSRAYKFDSAVQAFGLPTATRLEIQYAVFGNSSAGGFSKGAYSSNTEETEAAEGSARKNIMDTDLSAPELNTDPAISELNSYVASQQASSQNEYTGLFRGKNLILICAEAFSGYVIDPELTPTLYRLSVNGFNFKEYYQPFWGGSTSTGECSFLTGLAPQFNLDTIKMTEGNNNYFTLGNQLRKEGYYSLAFHNGNYDYFDRHLTHVNMGYSKYIAYGNGLEEILEENAGDAEMIDATMDLYIDHQPFSIYYMTISGHYPYVEDSPYSEKYYEKVDSVLGDRYTETTKYFFCYQMELDEALRIMVEKLEEAGIADDTVICLTADHYPYGLALEDSFSEVFRSENYIEDLYKGPDYYLWEKDRNTLILWSGCLENENKDMAAEIDEPTFSLDIVPTLSNLFGLEYDSRMLAGRDVFSDRKPLVFWNEGSWVTERGKYDIVTDKFFPAPGQEKDDEYIEMITNVVSDRKYFSGQVIMHDYYGALFGKTGSDNEN